MPPRKPGPSAKKPSPNPAYRNPPEAYRFKPGQSGNPSGRPKAIRSLAKELEAALRQTVTIRVRGKARRVSKLEAMTRALADMAAKGDVRTVRLLLDQLKGTEEPAEPEPEKAFTDADQAVIAALMTRIGGTREA